MIIENEPPAAGVPRVDTPGSVGAIQFQSPDSSARVGPRTAFTSRRRCTIDCPRRCLVTVAGGTRRLLHIAGGRNRNAVRPVSVQVVHFFCVEKSAAAAALVDNDRMKYEWITE